MHATHAVSPSASWYVPAPHGEHSGAFASENAPFLQAVALSAPFGQNDPAGHSVHADRPLDGAYEPSSHTLHTPL